MYTVKENGLAMEVHILTGFFAQRSAVIEVTWYYIRYSISLVVAWPVARLSSASSVAGPNNETATSQTQALKYHLLVYHYYYLFLAVVFSL